MIMRIFTDWWENSIIPNILESRRWTSTWQNCFMSARTKSKHDYELNHLNVCKLRSVDILVVVKVNIHANVSTIENYENKVVTPNSISNNTILPGTCSSPRLQYIEDYEVLSPIREYPHITLSFTFCIDVLHLCCIGLLYSSSSVMLACVSLWRHRRRP
jgi:hypothetical protein